MTNVSYFVIISKERIFIVIISRLVCVHEPKMGGKMKLYGALEAGGTKMVVAIGDENGKIIDKMSIPTTSPEETMSQIISYFRVQEISGRYISALGIASFGPVDVIPKSKTYGHILNTPKPGWKDYDILGELQRAFNIPMAIDTDVNGSCLGEMTYGCAKGLDSVVYITIGTGIGAGISVNGKLLHGMLHPEAGHMMIAKSKMDQGKSVCPFHESCFEGLASGPSIKARWGENPDNLVDNSVVWELESEYIAKGLVNIILTLSPQKIILGGGVMHQGQLFPLIREKVSAYINGYYNTKELIDMDSYIVPASLDDDQGIMGAVRIGQLAEEY